MGKGDQRTKKGKRVRGSYGNSRIKRPNQTPTNQAKADVVSAETEVETK